MKVFLTGATGGVGRHLTKRLLAAGHDVVAFDLKTRANERVAEDFPERIVHWGDVTERSTYAHLVDDIDVVVHLAFLVPPYSETHPKAWEINVGGTRDLLDELARRNPRCRFVFASSVVVFGDTSQETPPVGVDHPVCATDNYSVHKIECEELVRRSGLPWVVLRFSAAPYLEVSMRKFRQMYIIPWEQRLEFVHVLDVVTACANATVTPHVGETFIVAGGPRNQMIYGQQIRRIFRALWLPPPSKRWFAKDPFPLDWYDTARAQAILRYQERTFDDYLTDLREQFAFFRGLRRVKEFFGRESATRRPGVPVTLERSELADLAQGIEALGRLLDSGGGPDENALQQLHELLVRLQGRVKA
ncbi:MAG: NAD(P)-dependent oxidoreductase [Promethearchaeota archaeon]